MNPTGGGGGGKDAQYIPLQYVIGIVGAQEVSPVWRKVCWSEDAQLLALAYSDGAVEVCDTIGNH